MMRDNTVVAYVDKDPDGYRAVAAVSVLSRYQCSCVCDVRGPGRSTILKNM